MFSRARLQLVESMPTRLKARIYELEKNNNKLEAERINLCDQLSAAREKIQSYEQKRSVLERQLLFYKKTKETESVEVKEKGYCETSDRECKLKVMLEESKTKNEALEARVTDLRREVIKVTTRADELKEKLDDSKVRNEYLEQLNVEIGCDRIKESARAEKLEKLLAESQGSKKEAEKRISDLSEMLSASEEQSDRFYNLWKAALTRNTTLREQVKHLSTALTEVEEQRLQIDELKETNLKLEMEMEKQEDKAKLKDEKNELNSELRMDGASVFYQFM